MKNKGFTLIELLAVIVILAIIALIATPIILGIINDAREQSKKRTAELIAKETELAYTSYLFKGNGVGDADNFCTYMNGNFAMDNATVTSCSGTMATVTSGNDLYSVVYNNGLVEVSLEETKLAEVALKGSNGNSTKPRYYSWGSGSVGDNLPADANTDLSQVDTKGKSFYLKLESEDGETVSAAYACFTTGEPAVEYCLKGGDSGTAFSDNQVELDKAFPGPGDCYLGTDYGCSADGLIANADSNGFVDAGDGPAYCVVQADGRFECSEYEELGCAQPILDLGSSKFAFGKLLVPNGSVGTSLSMSL